MRHADLPVLRGGINILQTVELAARQGYAYVPGAIDDATRIALNTEAFNLNLTPVDHTKRALNAGTRHEVRQSHARTDAVFGAATVPVATAVINRLSQLVTDTCATAHPELKRWRSTHVAYQLYRTDADHISPHRDSVKDQLLSVTITVSGSARLLIYEPPDDPDDYDHLTQIDEFVANEGCLFLLRAAGFGYGERIIHQVAAPKRGTRLVVSLRMRPKLPSPPRTGRR